MACHFHSSLSLFIFHFSFFTFHFSLFHFTSEELRLFADDFREEEVGEARGPETEPLIRQPLFAEYFLDDGVVDEGIVNGV